MATLTLTSCCRLSEFTERKRGKEGEVESGGWRERERERSSSHLMMSALEMYHFMRTPLEGLKCTFGPVLLSVCRSLMENEVERTAKISGDEQKQQQLWWQKRHRFWQAKVT